MKQLIVALLVGGALTVSVAFAAGLGGISSGDLGVADGPVAGCDGDGVDVEYTVDYITFNFKVTHVTVSDIAAVCEGQTVDVALTNTGIEVSSGSGTVPVGGGSVTVAVAPQWPAVFVNDVHVAIYD